MLTRRTHGMLSLPLAVALLASTVACGEARPVALALTTTPDCTGCHGFPPATAAHAVHFNADGGSSGGLSHAQFTCLHCHKNVTVVNGTDHINRADGSLVPVPAEVRFDDPASLAAVTQPGATRAGTPAYDKAARTCSNVYCHGAGLKAAAKNAGASPAWDAPQGSVSCGDCHGIPPADHPAGLTKLDCTRCHGDAIDASGVPNPAKHVSGQIDLAAGVTTSCATCHGDVTARTANPPVNVPPGDPRSAPPTDAEGRPVSDASATSIGAHQNHVVAGVLGVKVACSECHVVPTTLLAPGHLDNQVTLTFGPLASKGGLTPTYDPATQTCSNVYCHGNFPSSKVTLPPTPPTWNVAVACGTCHDLPPPFPAHVPVDVTAQGCGTTTNPAISCHPAPYSPTTVDPTLHIDGKVCPPFCGP